MKKDESRTKEGKKKNLKKIDQIGILDSFWRESTARVLIALKVSVALLSEGEVS